MSSNSTPANVNRIRMASALPLIGKYVSLYWGIAWRNGEVNDSQPLFEWTAENVKPLGSNVIWHFGDSCWKAEKYFISNDNVCARSDKLEWRTSAVYVLFVPRAKKSLLQLKLSLNDWRFSFWEATIKKIVEKFWMGSKKFTGFEIPLSRYPVSH